MFLCITKNTPWGSRSSTTKLFDHILYSRKSHKKIMLKWYRLSKLFHSLKCKPKRAGRTWQEIKRDENNGVEDFWRWGKEIQTQRMLRALWSAAKLRGSHRGWKPHSVRAHFIAVTANTCGSRGRWWVGEGCYGVIGEQKKKKKLKLNLWESWPEFTTTLTGEPVAH